MSGKPKDLVGEKMGLLTVIRDSGERDKNGGHVMWECLCECGNVANVNGSRLKKGRTQSCGCYWYQGIWLAKSFGNSR